MGALCVSHNNLSSTNTIIAQHQPKCETSIHNLPCFTLYYICLPLAIPSHQITGARISSPPSFCALSSSPPSLFQTEGPLAIPSHQTTELLSSPLSLCVVTASPSSLQRFGSQRSDNSQGSDRKSVAAKNILPRTTVSIYTKTLWSKLCCLSGMSLTL
jgi:hypothetical protein